MKENNHRIWVMLQKADSDLQAALSLSKTNIPGKIDQVGFHLQQSVEKSLKVILMLDEVEYPVIKKASHNLSALLNLTGNTRAELPNSRKSILRLQSFAVDGRYDDIEESVTIDLDFMINLVIEFYEVASSYYSLKQKTG